MPRGLTSLILLLLAAAPVPGAPAVAAPPTADARGFREVVVPYFEKHCMDCHDADEAEGGLNLDAIDADMLRGEQFEQWRMIEESIRFGEMPPKKKPRPAAAAQDAVLKWIRLEMIKTQQPGFVADQKLLQPAFGNYVDHDALFGQKAGPVIPAAPRVWRLRPEAYRNLMLKLADKSRAADGLSQPFSGTLEPGFKDFSALVFLDEPSTDIMMRNAEMVIAGQAASGKFKELNPLLAAHGPATPVQVSVAVSGQFRAALRREPSADEAARFQKLYEETVKRAGHVAAGRAVLIAVLMLPETVFRYELCDGPPDALGLRRLAPRELAAALSYALRDQLDEELYKSAATGGLATGEQIAAQVKRLLADPKAGNPRVMEFFREYFGYPNAANVFKDKPARGVYSPQALVSDLEHLIQHVLAGDKDVFRELLTTNKAFVAYQFDTKKGAAARSVRDLEYETVYGLPPDWKWTDQQPLELPAEQRAGVLTHPAWLTAWSGNFHNDPVRRGKWVRTRLLGGTVPDVPIGVDAKIPDDEKRTLRDRLASVTANAECWRCHRKMDPLGLPFERFDHYGYYRRFELDLPVVATGEISRVADPLLTGAVADPVAMLHRLAGSERVEQVFIRHAFRFFMGRNETLGDAATLQRAHAAYRQSGGSFNALIVSLLSSDSFLFRSGGPAQTISTALPSAPTTSSAGPQPAGAVVRVGTIRKKEDRVDATAKDGAIALLITSPSGIGTATLHRTGASWGRKITLKLRYSAEKAFSSLEGAEATLIKDPAPLHEQSTKLRVNVVRDKAGGTAEIILPPEADNFAQIQIEWIDAYR